MKIRESLNAIDRRDMDRGYGYVDLVTMFESINMTPQEKQEFKKIVDDGDESEIKGYLKGKFGDTLTEAEDEDPDTVDLDAVPVEEGEDVDVESEIMNTDSTEESGDEEEPSDRENDIISDDPYRAIASEFDKYVANNYPSIGRTLESVDGNEITFNVSWGDWKHEHRTLDVVAEDWFPQHGYNIVYENVDTYEEDESDTYSARHIFKIKPKTDDNAVKDVVADDEEEFIPDDDYGSTGFDVDNEE